MPLPCPWIILKTHALSAGRNTTSSQKRQKTCALPECSSALNGSRDWHLSWGRSFWSHHLQGVKYLRQRRSTSGHCCPVQEKKWVVSLHCSAVWLIRKIRAGVQAMSGGSLLRDGSIRIIQGFPDRNLKGFPRWQQRKLHLLRTGWTAFSGFSGIPRSMKGL